MEWCLEFRQGKRRLLGLICRTVVSKGPYGTRCNSRSQIQVAKVAIHFPQTVSLLSSTTTVLLQLNKCLFFSSDCSDLLVPSTQVPGKA